ncbi:MAG: hypothetical protein ABIR32_00025 [Ilumatobacteraceae bacterium]
MRVPSAFRLAARAVLVLIAGCASDDSPSTSIGSSVDAVPTTVAQAVVLSTTMSSTTSVAAPPIPVRMIEPSARIELLNPDWLASDEQFVYTRLDTSEVVRLDPATGATLGMTEVGGLLCNGLGAAFGSVWSCLAVGDDPEQVVRIDPATDKVVATIEIGKARFQGNLVGGFDRLWVLVGDGSQLVGIDPITNVVDKPIDLGVIGYDVAVGTDAVWVISNRDDAVVRVDPVSRAVTDRIDRIAEPVAIDASSDVWIGSVGATVRIDSTSFEVSKLPISVGYSGAIVVDDENVWIRSVERFVVRVDATTGEAVEQFDASAGSGGDMIIAFGALWATAYDDDLLVRQPL